MLWALIALISFRLLFWVLPFPNPDEAYYWLWGQHPDWSYYDHPPFQAWVQGLLATVFGSISSLPKPWLLRLPNLISTCIIFYTYNRILRYLYRDRWQDYWLPFVLLVFASPLYFLFLALAWPDHGLILFSLISCHLFITFLDRYRQDGQGITWRLYSSAIALGGAFLCKYNSLFVAIGFGLTILTTPQLRPLWRDRRLWMAVAIALLGFVPIVIWNVSNHFLSVQYYVNRSVSAGSLGLKIGPFLNFILFSILMVSPFYWPTLLSVLKQGWQSMRSGVQPSDFHDARAIVPSLYTTVAVWVFLSSTVPLIVISLLSAALYYWNITAYLLLLPLLVERAIRTRWFRWGQGFGVLFAGLLVIHYGVVPLSALVSSEGDPDSRMLFGWSQVASVVNEHRQSFARSPWLLTTDYRSASALAYALNDKTVIALSDRRDQFDIWSRQLESGLPQRALVLFDDWHPLNADIQEQFETVSSPIIVPVHACGVWVKNYYLVKVQHFRPLPPIQLAP